MMESTNDQHDVPDTPAWIDEPDPVSAPEKEAEGRDPDALARLSDPSMTDRRARIKDQVRDRSGLRWVPASELLRYHSQRAGDVITRGQERLHRAAGAAVARGGKSLGAAARTRAKGLGPARPITRTAADTIPAVERSGPGA